MKKLRERVQRMKGNGFDTNAIMQEILRLYDIGCLPKKPTQKVADHLKRIGKQGGAA